MVIRMAFSHYFSKRRTISRLGLRSLTWEIRMPRKLVVSEFSLMILDEVTLRPLTYYCVALENLFYFFFSSDVFYFFLIFLHHIYSISRTSLLKCRMSVPPARDYRLKLSRTFLHMIIIASCEGLLVELFIRKS